VREERDGGDRRGHRKGDDQRPTDRAGATEVSGERAALGVAQSTEDDRREEEQIGGFDRPRGGVADGEEGEHGGQAGPARCPEHRGRPLGRPEHRERGGDGRQHGHDHRAVRRRLRGERQRGEQWKPDHHADGDDGEPPPLRRAGPGGPNKPEVRPGQQPGAHRAAEGDQPGVEFVDGDLGSGERHAEGEDAQGAERATRYSTGSSSVTIVLHGRR
jgi:hypothetical protein